MSFYSKIELEELGLKEFGENVQISKKASIYNAENISIGSNVRIDDFCLLSGSGGSISIGSYIHVAAYSAIYGGGGVVLKDFSGLASRCVIYSTSDDYSGAYLTNPTVPDKYLNIQRGIVILNKHVLIGTNSTIFPGVEIGEGSAVGAHSLVTKKLEEWGIYFGSPARKLKNRKKDLLEMENAFYQGS
ncbi:galactoside O-acetyltransferase [Pontibacillus chungwhensis BH030062]|uniref:Galactoside O-acetyltransferase n=1 Tax=Pontibacillus chungwhensis BH030062 TaxID=1385513 RepID=A0A0A2VCN6_9BACI|nr:acyltransferase [Pontibacillus chungwhensis]KGP91395.1 galactoside O-acetyltransferase [Pontibacillus chungwhensis BH030062]